MEVLVLVGETGSGDGWPTRGNQGRRKMQAVAVVYMGDGVGAHANQRTNSTQSGGGWLLPARKQKEGLAGVRKKKRMDLPFGEDVSQGGVCG
jgi:hypothetical protein